ncbi:MAG: peptidylprolyl isomerase [Acidobacteriota bacterium]
MTTPKAVRRAACAAALFAGAIGLGPAARAQQGILEQVIVTVNGDLLTSRQIDERVRVTLAGLADRHPDAAANLPAPSAADLLPGILSDAVDELLMVQRAAELGLEATERDVDSVIASIKVQSRVDSDEAFAALLMTEGITLPALRDTTRRQMLIAAVKEQLFKRITVSDDEARRYFETHRASFERPATATYRELVVAIAPSGSGEQTTRDAALVKFVTAGDRLVSGIPFAQVARQYSEAPSAAAGGLVDAQPLDALDPMVRAALARLRSGELSGPVATSAGYQFLKLEAVAAALPPVFSEAAADSIERVREAKQQASVEALLDGLRGAAILRWKGPGFEALYDRRPH